MVAATASATQGAQAVGEAEFLPGSSREVTRSTSASLDAPVTTIVFTPRVELKAAADVGLFRWDLSGVALRPGLAGFCDLQYADPGGFWPVPPPTGQILFRGHYEFSVSLSAEHLARKSLGPRGAIEVAILGGHESDHVLGSGGPESGFVNAPKPGDIVSGGGGNFFGTEVAIRAPMPSAGEVWARIADRRYIAGPILHEPSIEGGLRWHLWPHAEPVVSVFFEGLLVDPNQNAGRNGGDGELLAGVAFPGRWGELTPFASAQVGNQKGLLINHREFDVVLGVRYAPF